MLAVVAAIATLIVLANPAMAQTFDSGGIDIGGPITGDLLVGSGDFGNDIDSFGDFGDCSFGCNDQSVTSLGGSSIGGVEFS
jgi:hypothetical protein